MNLLNAQACKASVRAPGTRNGKNASCPSFPQAFTLIELLVVLAIIIIIAAFAVPSTNNMMRGNKITQATQTIVDQLTLARQTAISSNHPVEVRFYKFAAPGVPGALACFRGLQALEVPKANIFTPLEKMQSMPLAVIIDSSTSLSSLLDPTKRTLVVGSNLIPQVSGTTSYIALRFRPDGSTDLSPTGAPWFLTLHDEIKGDNLGTPPANFVTIEIDPVSGTLIFFRPGV